MPCLELGLDNWLYVPSRGQNASDENKGASAKMCQIHTVCTHRGMEQTSEKLSSNCELPSARPLSGHGKQSWNTL